MKMDPENVIQIYGTVWCLAVGTPTLGPVHSGGGGGGGAGSKSLGKIQLSKQACMLYIRASRQNSVILVQPAQTAFSL